MYKKFDHTVKRVSTLFASISASCITLLMVVMIADIATRVASGRSLAGALEIGETLLVLVVFFAIAYGERNGDNIRVTLLETRLSRDKVLITSFIGTAVATFVAVWLAVSSWSAAFNSIAINEYQVGLVQFPLWPTKLVIAFGFSLLIFEFLATLLRTAKEFNEFRAAKSQIHTVSEGVPSR